MLSKKNRKDNKKIILEQKMALYIYAQALITMNENYNQS